MMLPAMDWRQARVLGVLCQWRTEVSSSASQSIRLLRLSVISALAVVTQTVTVFHLECAFLLHRCARAADSVSTRLCRWTQSWARLIACRRRRHPCPLCSHKFCPTGWPSSASTRRVGSKRNLLSPLFSLFIIYFIFPLHSSRCLFFCACLFHYLQDSNADYILLTCYQHARAFAASRQLNPSTNQFLFWFCWLLNFQLMFCFVFNLYFSTSMVYVCFMVFNDIFFFYLIYFLANCFSCV